MNRCKSVNVRMALVLALSALMASCVKRSSDPNDPKERIKEYISVSFGIKEVKDRSKLEALLAGDAKIRLASWSDDQFKKAFVDARKEFIKLVFVETKKNSEEETVVTYELTYLDKLKETQAKVTQKKLARMIRKNGQWYIDSVKNVKELFEYPDGLEVGFP